MKLALGLHDPLPVGMCALHQANVDIHGPNTIFAARSLGEVVVQTVGSLEDIWREHSGAGVAWLSYSWCDACNQRSQDVLNGPTRKRAR
jgi:hypothetical protein